MERDALKGRELWLLAAWLLATLALRPLLLPDEGRYAGVAFEMLHGSVLLPTLDGLPYFHKPPLLYWLDVLGMRLFGVNEFAVRLGPALLGWLLGAALFLHLRRWHGAAVARIGLAVLATSPFFFVGAQYVNHDVGVAACITAAVLAAVRAVEGGRGAERRWLLLAWACCALGFLAKGLIGVVLPAWVLGPWLLAQGRWRQVLALLHPLGLLLFAAIALPWPLAMQAQHAGFFDYFIVEQHFRRYAETSFNNRQPFWFLFAALPLLMLPWSPWLARLAPVLRGGGARVALYAWWLVAVLIFFSLPASKLVGYAMPALAPAAALLALVFAQRGTAWPRLLVLAALLCVGAVLALAWRAPGSQRDIGLALRERWQPGDRLVFVEEPFFDLRFYARIAEPAIIVSDWSDPRIAYVDNWRKELADAARFAPERGSALLWGWSRLPELPCHAGTVWIVSAAALQARLAALPGLETAATGHHAVLQRLAGHACPGKVRP